MRAGDHAIQARVQGLADPPLDQVAHLQPVAQFGQVLLVQAGQDRDPDDLDVPGSRTAEHRGGHHLRLGVDGQKIAGAGGDDGGRGLLHRRADVVQLPVQEHLPATSLQLLGHVHAAAGQKLQADLVIADRIAQPLDHGFGVRPGRQVQRDNQAGVCADLGRACGGGGHRDSDTGANTRAPDVQGKLGRRVRGIWAKRRE